VTAGLRPSTSVHQVLATLGYGDAIGNEALGTQLALRAVGYRSDIFVETADPRLESFTRDFRELADENRSDNVLIHHFSIGWRASRLAYALPDRMMLVYHNITPPRYFVGIHTLPARFCYHDMLPALVSRFDWRQDRFVFTGPVPDAELAAYYRAASVYLSMSEHEGFCVPLVEAMATDVPVLAYSCTAIPETLGGAGVQFAPLDFELAAELLYELAYDDGVRTAVMDGQRRRLTHFLGSRVDADLRQPVGRFL